MKMKKWIAFAVATCACAVMMGCSADVEVEQAQSAEDTSEVEVLEKEEGLLPDDTGGEEFVYEEE